tara:strand:- start:4960 stop:6501 length:1542 start_codon:yes stop_codon:yes gene_type:complete
MDDLRRQSSRMAANFSLGNSIATDIDLYYRFKLPRTFDFQMNQDATELLFTPPRVTAWRDDVPYTVTLAEDNELENFWYNAVPASGQVTETVAGSNQDYLMLRDNPVNSPFELTSYEVPLEMKLLVTVSGSLSCIQDINGKVALGTVQILGEDVNGQELTEDVVFLYDDAILTQNEFTSVSGIKAWGFTDPDDTIIMVTANHFNDSSLQETRYHQTAYELAFYKSGEGQSMPLFWTLGFGEHDADASHATLEAHMYDVDDIGLRVDGWTSRSVAFRYDLLDEDDVPITPIDMCVEPWSRRIWVVTSGMLYLYNDKMDGPTYKSLDRKIYSAESVIEPSSLQVVSGEEIGLDYHWRRPTKGMRRHRAWVEKPDGSIWSLEDDAEVTYHTDRTSWIVGEPARKLLRRSEHYVLDQYGIYTYSLETTYTDGTSTIDQRAVQVAKKNPEASFALTDLGIGVTTEALGIDVNAVNDIMIFDTSYNRHLLSFDYDVMLIDIQRKIIYFRDQYTRVEATY